MCGWRILAHLNHCTGLMVHRGNRTPLPRPLRDFLSHWTWTTREPYGLLLVHLTVAVYSYSIQPVTVFTLPTQRGAEDFPTTMSIALYRTETEECGLAPTMVSLTSLILQVYSIRAPTLCVLSSKTGFSLQGKRSRRWLSMEVTENG